MHFFDESTSETLSKFFQYYVLFSLYHPDMDIVIFSNIVMLQVMIYRWWVCLIVRMAVPSA